MYQSSSLKVCTTISVIMAMIFISPAMAQGIQNSPGHAISSTSSAGPLSARRQFHFEYQTTVTMPANGQSATIHIPVPENSPSQTITNVSFDAPVDPHIYHDPEHGNKIARFQLGPDAGETKRIKMTFNVDREQRELKPDRRIPDQSFSDHPYLKRFTDHHPYMEKTERVSEIARKVAGDRDTYYGKIRGLYEKVMGMMSYDKSGEGWGEGDISYCINVGKGNCTDFHTFFDSLARERGIPAQFIMGFPIPRTVDSGNIGGYHCWTEVYVPHEGWMPLDISEADKHKDLVDYYFGTVDADRITMTKGKNIKLSSGQRVNYLVYPVVESEGNARVETSFSFRNR